MRKTVTELAMPEQSRRLIRLAPYTRVSSGSDDQLHSFAAQVKYYTEYAAAHPEYELVDIYADEAVTGTRMDKRDDLNRLLRDCRKGKIDRIITKSVSRFARNTTELLTMVRGLKELGVSIYFEEQGIDTAAIDLEMILTFPGMAAQKESETISENMRWSYQKRMESGDFNCCKAAYGYELIDGQLYINEAEAPDLRPLSARLREAVHRQPAQCGWHSTEIRLQNMASQCHPLYPEQRTVYGRCAAPEELHHGNPAIPQKKKSRRKAAVLCGEQ